MCVRKREMASVMVTVDFEESEGVHLCNVWCVHHQGAHSPLDV
jgi:hypothetical protein